MGLYALHERLPKVDLYAWDHNRDVLVRRISATFTDPKARQAYAGIAYHWYDAGCSAEIAKVHAYLSLASTSYTIANFGSTMYFKRYSENGSSYWNEGISSSMSNIQAGNSNTILMSPSSDTAGSTSDSFGFLYKSTLVEQATYGTNTYLYSYQLYASGTNYSPSVTNTPSGYQFDGWYTDAAYTTAYTPAEMTADLTLYAKYSEVVNQYTVHVVIGKIRVARPRGAP